MGRDESGSQGSPSAVHDLQYHLGREPAPKLEPTAEGGVHDDALRWTLRTLVCGVDSRGLTIPERRVVPDESQPYVVEVLETARRALLARFGASVDVDDDDVRAEGVIA